MVKILFYRNRFVSSIDGTPAMKFKRLENFNRGVGGYGIPHSGTVIPDAVL